MTQFGLFEHLRIKVTLGDLKWHWMALGGTIMGYIFRLEIGQTWHNGNHNIHPKWKFNVKCCGFWAVFKCEIQRIDHMRVLPLWSTYVFISWQCVHRIHKWIQAILITQPMSTLELLLSLYNVQDLLNTYTLQAFHTFSGCRIHYTLRKLTKQLFWSLILWAMVQ